jgi:hypothetical protein
MFTTDELVDKAANFLLKYAKAETGFYSQGIGVGRGATPTTANAILALYDAGKISKDSLDNLIEELFTFQYPPEARYAYTFCIEEISSNWSTAKAVYTILKTSPQKINQSRITLALEWLTENRNNDNGWGYRKNDPSRPYYTFFAAQALLEAWLLTVEPGLKAKYEDVLNKICSYLTRCRLEDGTWTDGQGDTACPVNTLMAMATLRLLERVSGFSPESSKDWESSLTFIKENFMNPETWKNLSWEEPGISFKRIEPFPPGKIDILLNVIDPFDELIVYLIGWIRKNVIVVDHDSIGWLPVQAGAGKPYSWSVARILLSLSSFKRSVASYNKLKLIQPLEEKVGAKWRFVNKSTFKLSLVFYASLITILSLVITGMLLKDLFLPFEFKKVADNIFLLVLIVFLLSSLWVFTINFMKRGRANILEILSRVRHKMKRWWM